MSGSKAKREWVPLDRLVRDPRLQMRTGLADGLTEPATVERYRDALADGEMFPPLEVVADETTYWLVDGFQRAAAHDAAGTGSAECLVYPGEYRDALLRAIAANSRHGLTRTGEDCRRALTTLLGAPELLERVLAGAAEAGGIHRALAAACGVSKGMVYRILEERGLRAIAGKLVKKRMAPAGAEVEAENAGKKTALTDRPASAPPAQRDRSDDFEPAAAAGDSVETLDLDRALAAIEALWVACRTLLDGQWSAHLLRCAASHGIPFGRADRPGSPIGQAGSTGPLSSVAWWEPLGKIEAAFADLYAAATAASEP